MMSYKMNPDAVPRKIRELMNVDGITIKQIASHLQVLCIQFFTNIANYNPIEIFFLQKHRKTHRGRLSKRAIFPQHDSSQPGKLPKRKPAEKKSSASSHKPTLRPLLPKYPPSMLCARPPPVRIHGGMQRPDQQMLVGNAVESSGIDNSKSDGEKMPHNFDGGAPPEVGLRRDELQSRGTGEVASKGSSSITAAHENSEGFGTENFNSDEDLIAEIIEEIDVCLGRAPP